MAIGSAVCVVYSPNPTKDAAFLNNGFNESKTLNPEDPAVVTIEDLTIVFVSASNPLVTLWTLKSGPALEQLLDTELGVARLRQISKFEIDLPILSFPSGAKALLVAEDNEKVNHAAIIAALQCKPADLQDFLDAQEENCVKQRLFPTLDMKVLREDGSFSPFYPNATEPFDIETDLFKGKIIVLCRPSNPEMDPHWNDKVFSKKRRNIIIQIQGRFKRQPDGVVYAGAEVSDPMKLGFLTKGICSVLLRLVESFNNNVHYSYGDGNGELPHIVAPAFTFFQKLIVTPPGQDPPSIVDLLEEPEDASQKRRNATTFGTWNTTDTYSFSFYSMYIDLPKWKLVSLPATGDIKLQTFWNDSLLRICMYEAKSGAKRHCQGENQYVFSVQAQFIEDADETRTNNDRGSYVLPLPKRRNGSDRVIDQNSTTSLDDSQVFDLVAISTRSDRSEPEESELAFFDAEEGDDEDIRFASPYTSSQLLEKIDTLCPFWIDHWFAGSTERSFAVSVASQIIFRTENECNNLIQAASKHELNHVLREHFSSRLSAHEKVRRSIGILISSPKQCGVDETKLASFLSEIPENEGLSFILGSTQVEEPDASLEGFVARSVSDRHWVHEWAKVSSSGQSLLFFRSSDKKKPRYRLNLRTVSKVEEIKESEGPNASAFRVLALSSIGRSTYLMLRDGPCYLKWLRQLKIACSRKSEESESPDVFRLFEIDNLEDEFMHNSSMWACKNRRILNSARFYFRQSAFVEDAEDLSKAALNAAMDAQTSGLDDESKRQTFLSTVSKLKNVSLVHSDEKAKLAFFLNVYHTMITHAFLILGPPQSSLRWFNFFNTISYQVADDIFSLSELEHCIFRSESSQPSQFFSRFIIPKSKYHYSVSFDYRVNFALNCGSLSNPETVFMYDSEHLDEQLDAAGILFLKTIEWKKSSNGSVTLFLPRMIQWYAEDFGSSREQRRQRLLKFLPRTIQKELQDAPGYEIKYHSFNFECRPLVLSAVGRNNLDS